MICFHPDMTPRGPLEVEHQISLSLSEAPPPPPTNPSSKKEERKKGEKQTLVSHDSDWIIFAEFSPPPPPLPRPNPYHEYRRRKERTENMRKQGRKKGKRSSMRSLLNNFFWTLSKRPSPTFAKTYPTQRHYIKTLHKKCVVTQSNVQSKKYFAKNHKKHNGFIYTKEGLF